MGQEENNQIELAVVRSTGGRKTETLQFSWMSDLIKTVSRDCQVWFNLLQVITSNKNSFSLDGTVLPTQQLELLNARTEPGIQILSTKET